MVEGEAVVEGDVKDVENQRPMLRMNQRVITTVKKEEDAADAVVDAVVVREEVEGVEGVVVVEEDEEEGEEDVLTVQAPPLPKATWTRNRL